MFYLREKIGEAQKRKHSPLAGSTTYTARENFGSNPHTIHFLGKGRSEPSENNLLN
jgi:hypothetical protein